LLGVGWVGEPIWTTGEKAWFSIYFVPAVLVCLQCWAIEHQIKKLEEKLKFRNMQNVVPYGTF
jgi:Ni/Fe-hydrogenase subunit HybB-like protein